MEKKHFDDLTKIDCPFGELDDDTAGRLFLAWRNGAEVQCHFVAHGWTALGSIPSWAPIIPFRLAPQPVTPDYIDWSQVADRFMCMATGFGDWTFCYGVKPRWDAGMRSWSSVAQTVPADAYSSFRRGTVAPEDSLQFRPGYEPK